MCFPESVHDKRCLDKSVGKDWKLLRTRGCLKELAQLRPLRSEILVKQSVSLGKNLHVYTAYCRL